MKNERTTSSFSFLLSDSPPPADARHHDEAADADDWAFGAARRLELDLTAFESELPPATCEGLLPDEELTRTPAPTVEVAAAASPAPAATAPAVEVAAAASPEAPAPAPAMPAAPRTEDLAGAGPAIKQIAFPRRQPAAATVFSSSVSQAPRVRLDSSDEEALEGALQDVADGPGALTPDDLPATASLSATTTTPRASWRAGLARAPSTAWTDFFASSRETTRKLQRATLRRVGGLQGLRDLAWARGLGQRARRGVHAALAGTQRRAQHALAPGGGATSTHEPSLGVDRPQVEALPTAPPDALAEAPHRGARRRQPRFGKQSAKPLASLGAAALAAFGCYYGASQLLPGALAPSPSLDTPALSNVRPAEALTGGGDAPGEASGEDSPDEAPGEDAPGAAEAPGTSAAPRQTPAPAVDKLSMPDGLRWPGKGLIEVVTSDRELIYVDGVFTGRGPLRRIPVGAGKHEVILRSGANERRSQIDVEVDRRTRVLFGS